MDARDDRFFMFALAAFTMLLFPVVGAKARAANTAVVMSGSQAPIATRQQPGIEQQRNDAKNQGERAINRDADVAIEEARIALENRIFDRLTRISPASQSARS